MNRTFSLLFFLFVLLIGPVLAQDSQWVDFTRRHRVLIDMEHPSAKEEVLEFPGLWGGDSKQEVTVKVSERSKGYHLSVRSPKGKRFTTFISHKKSLAQKFSVASQKSKK